MFCQLDTRVGQKEESTIEKRLPSGLPTQMRKDRVYCVESYHWTSSAGFYKKEAGQAIGSKPVRNPALNSASMFLLESHPLQHSMEDWDLQYNQNKLFPLQVLFCQCLITATNSKNMFKLYCILVWKYSYENQYHVQWMYSNENTLPKNKLNTDRGKNEQIMESLHTF